MVLSQKAPPNLNGLFALSCVRLRLRRRLVVSLYKLLSRVPKDNKKADLPPENSRSATAARSSHPLNSSAIYQKARSLDANNTTRESTEFYRAPTWYPKERCKTMPRKKVDNRIRVLVENGVNLGHRTMFVIVGDKGKDQVRPLKRHTLISAATIESALVM